MKKILFVLYAVSGGGIESMLYSYLSKMDRSGLQFDFAVCTPQTGDMEKTFEAMGCKIFHLPKRSESLPAHCKALEELIKKEKYDIVHSHQSENAFITLSIAKKCGVPVRICHCHNAYPPESKLYKIRRIISSVLNKIFATHLFACSPQAACWLYGKKKFEKGKVTIVTNAMELSKFAFSEKTRAEKRAELGLENKTALCCVGRLEEQKNHTFLLDIFKAFLKKRPDSVLLIAGDGSLREGLIKKADDLGIAEKVNFMGIRRDIPQLLCACDAFVLPTLFEGLGIVFVEAQATGIPTFCTDIIGVKSAKTTSLMHLIPPTATAEDWAKAIVENIDIEKRESPFDEIAAGGFEINDQVNKLEKFYRTVI